MKKLLLLILLVPFLGFGQTTDLFFSEYAEGSSNNKYLEIYNGTGAAVDLANYSVSYSNNGCNTLGSFDTPNGITWPTGTMLANNDFYIIAHPSSSATILAAADMTSTDLSNGDDVFALISGSTGNSIIDIIGDLQGDPGTGWAVAGTANATANHTLVRKSTVCVGNATELGSFGTSVATSEWIVNASDDWTNLNAHTATCSSSCNISASGITALTCNDAGTPTLPLDDYLTFSLNPTGSVLGTNYNLTVSGGGTITPTTAAYGSAISFQLQAGSAGAGNVTVTITDDTGGTCTFDQIITDPGACSSAVPVITLTPSSLTGFNHLVGTPSAEQTFTASGIGLADDITIAAPTNFEISLTTGTGFTNSIVLAQVSNSVPTTTIYTRANASAMGTISGSIVATSTGADNDTVMVSGYANDYVTYMIDDINGTNAAGVADSLNVLATITGVVQCGDFDYNAGYSFALVDGNGDGINIYKSSDLANYLTPMAGDSIRVRGKVLQYNGLLELQADSILVLGTGMTATPMVVLTLSEATESMPVEVMNLTLVTPIATFTANSSILANNGTDTVSIRIPTGSPLDGTAAPQGLFNVTGIGWQFDSSSPYTTGYQLYPCAFVDVCTIPANTTTMSSATTASSTVAGIQYQWINCSDSSAVANATNQSFTAILTGSYAVIVTDGDCSDTSACVSLTGTSAGINENTLLNSVSVYPNPVQDYLTVKNTSNEVISFVVVDMNGKEVLTSKSVLTSEVISTSTWNKGVYFVKFSSTNGEAVLRVVK